MAKASKQLPRSLAVDIPSQVFTATDNALEVTAIIDAHDRGILSRSAMLWDAMMTDDRALAIMQRRSASLTILPRIIKASSHSARAKSARIARILGGDDQGDDDGLFSDYVPDATIKTILSWGIGLGAVAVQKIFDPKATPWGFTLKPWSPQFLFWQLRDQRFYLITQNRGSLPMPREGEDDPEFFMWCPYGQQYGWRRAVVRALCYRYLQRKWNDRDWSRYDEVHGIPGRVAEYPASEAGSPQVEQYLADVANMGNEPMIALPKGDGDKAGYDVRLLEATAKTYETFRDHRNEINRDMGILVLGENDTTDSGSTGQAGSFAKNKVAQMVSGDKAKEDAAFGACLRQGVLRQWSALNWGDPELAPVVTWQTEEPEDEQVRAQTLQTLGTALQGIKLAVGDRIDEDAILERFGVPIRQTKEQYDIENPAPEPGSEPGTDVGGVDPGDGSDKPPGKREALAALKSLEAPRTKLLYPERVAAEGAALGAKKLAGYRRALVDAVKGASSPEDARDRLAKAFKLEADPEGLAEVVKRVRLMGLMAGRFTANREVSK